MIVNWLISFAGGALVLFVLRDLFLTLWVPDGCGPIQLTVSRTWWRFGRERSAKVRRLIGPWTLAAVILSWGLLAVLGWALVYMPHMDTEFLYAIGLEPASRSDVLDALYLSLVALTTLGFGDIVATGGWVRMLPPVEALMGFALWTASVTWVLQIYPALGRRSALAAELAALQTSNFAGRIPDVDESVVSDIAFDLAAGVRGVRADLLLYAQTYYFFEHQKGSLSRTLPCALAIRDAARRDERHAVVLAGDVLAEALDDLLTVLSDGFLHAGSEESEILDAYRRDHGRD